jgi:hypothetical protein
MGKEELLVASKGTYNTGGAIASSILSSASLTDLYWLENSDYY